MEATIITSHTKTGRGTKKGARERYQSALNDLRSQLAGGSWRPVPVTELTKIHNVSAGLISTLVRHHIIEQNGRSTRDRQYRRTEKLNHISAEVCMQMINKDAKDLEKKREGKVPTFDPKPLADPATPEPPKVEAISPATPEPLSVEVSHKINGKRLTVTITLEGSERAADFAKLLEQATGLLLP